MAVNIQILVAEANRERCWWTRGLSMLYHLLVWWYCHFRNAQN